jgi:hypothetical protein
MNDTIELSNRPVTTIFPPLLIVGFNEGFSSKVDDIAEIAKPSLPLFYKDLGRGRQIGLDDRE